MTNDEYNHAIKSLENGKCFSPRSCSICYTKLWVCKHDDEYFSDTNCACVTYHAPMTRINAPE